MTNRTFPGSAVSAGGVVSTAQAGPPGALTEEERALLSRVEDALARGRILKEWWRRACRADSFRERFVLARSGDSADRGFGFFDLIAREGGGGLPVLGSHQKIFFDRPKARRGTKGDSRAWMRAQVREFVLHYFLRVGDFRAPPGVVEPGAATTPSFGGPPAPPAEPRRGFGFQQLFYKRLTGEVGQFSAGERFAIVDLRELGRRFEWIVLKAALFDFSVTLEPFGPGGPRMVLPAEEETFLVLAGDLLCDEERADGGGRYSIGCALLESPRRGPLTYGSAGFDAAIELIDWEVARDGTVRAEVTFVARRPDRASPVDPLAWGLRAADLMSLGLASRLLAPFQSALGAFSPHRGVDPVLGLLSLANLLGGQAVAQPGTAGEPADKEFLLRHFMQQYQLIAGTLGTWRQVADWLDPAGIPARVITGKST